MTDEQRLAVAMDALGEWCRARHSRAPMRGPHEGYAVLLEEVDELWEIVKMNPKKAYPHASEPHATHREAMRKEALQVAAMALAFVGEVC